MAADPPAKTTLISDSEGYTRLHITPLDADLLKVVVPAAVLPQARNISYHTLETFPEKRYGFVELPTTDADKLRKKLNGATLRGTKVRIEQARPVSIPQPTSTMAEDSSKTKKPKKDKALKAKELKDKIERSKKRKLGSEVVEGVAIEDRKIKRGWTVTESDKIQEKRKEKTKKSTDKDGKKEKKLKKRETKSKYTNEPECLFKQKLPDVPNEKVKEKSEKTDADDEEDEPKRKKRRGDRLVVMHEFEKTTKYPTFLKANGDLAAPKPLTFEDGKGWVDSDGNVVESSKSKRPTFSSKAKLKKQRTLAPISSDDDTSSSGSSSESDSDDDAKVPARSKSPKIESKKSVPTPDDDDETSSSGSSSSDEESAAEEPTTVKVKSPKPAVSKSATVDDDDETSSSGSSSDEESESEAEETKSAAVTPKGSKELKLDTESIDNPISALKNDSSRPKSSGSATSLTIKIPSITPTATKVHPLEALYKRPAGTEAPADTGFSFFGNEDDIEEDDNSHVAPSGSQNPMTPFSKQDFDFRNIRSAAPTPDTAHPSRSQSLWPGPGSGEDDLDEEDEGLDGEDAIMANATDSKGPGKATSKSEFQDWFWEHRGDLNRSWKKRRKTASKEKRNRENRARAAKAI